MNQHHGTAHTSTNLASSTTPGTRTSRTRSAVALLGMTGLLSLTACGDTGGEAAQAPADGAAATETTAAGTETTGTAGANALATAAVKDTDGNEVGTVEFSEAEGDTVDVKARFSGMDPGFYGFHVHTKGVCEPDSAAPDDPDKTGAFLSAGGHLDGGDADHPAHAGDLPSLLVTGSGDAHLTLRTDRLTAENLMDEDGSSVMVHEHEENYANVPGRYGSSGPDEDTLKAGDAGSRLACGVVEDSRS